MDATQPLDNDFGMGMTISPEIRSYLTETAKWAKFLSILGFIMVGLMVIIALFAGTIIGPMLATMGQAGGAGMIGGTFLTIFYLILAGICFFPVFYLYRFATKMQIALKNEDQTFLAGAMENLKSHYKFNGIFAAVVLVIYALFFILAIVGGAFASMN